MRILITILLLVSIEVSAQIESYDKLSLKFTPSSLLSLTSPAVQMGLEFRPRKNFGINTEVGSNFGGLKYAMNCMDCSGQQYNHLNYKWKEEIRWYWQDRRSSNIEYYFAQEFFVLADYFKLRKGYSNLDKEYFSFSTANHNRIGIGTTSKLGILYHWGSRFRVEAAVGIGVRHHQISTFLYGEKPLGVFDGDSSPTSFDRNKLNYNQVLPHVAANLRVGYVLWK